MTPLRLLILGASGGCGAHVVREAAKRGHHVTALARPGTSYDAPDGVHLLRDEVLRDGALEDAIDDGTTVISCLGIKRTQARNPWSELVSPADFTTRVAELLVRAVRAKRGRRVLLVSAAGVADSEPLMSALFRFVVNRSNIGVAYRDLARAEEIYRASGVEWSACRPVTLTDFCGGRAIAEVPRYGLFATIPRADVARWLVDRAEDPRPLDAATPMIAAA